MRALLKRLTVGLGILGLGIGAFLWLGSMKDVPAREVARESRPLVKTIPITKLRSKFDIELDGTVVPQREITVAAEVVGEIIFKSAQCQAGNYVSAGTRLLQIDPRKYELKVERLQSLLEQAEIDVQRIDVEQRNVDALVAIAERDLELKKREFQRIGGLVERNAAAAGEQDSVEATILAAETALQNLKNQKDLFPSRRSRAQAEVRLRRSELADAEIDLAKTKIVAPIAGVIVKASVECQQFVNASTELLTIEDTSVAEVSCQMRVDDLFWLWGSRSHSMYCEGAEQSDRVEDVANPQPCYQIPPARAKVTFRLGDQQFQWNGQLARYEGTGINAKTRTVPCRVVVDKPQRIEPGSGPPALVRGMFVKVALEVDAPERLLEIPHLAVRPNGEVFAVRDGKLSVQRVIAAKVLPETLLIRESTSELKIGDRLVTSPLAAGFDGMPVRESPSR